MNLSSVFKNHAKCSLVMAPVIAATVSAVTFGGVGAAIPCAVIGTITILGFKAVDNLVHDTSRLTAIKPAERWREIASEIGLPKMPRIYRYESEEQNAHAAYGSVVMESAVLDSFEVDEIDDIFAHECAHIKRLDGLLQPLSQHAATYSVLSAVWGICNIVFFNNTPEEFISNGIGVIGHAAAAFIATPFSMNNGDKIQDRHEAEFDCDRRAVLATNNIDAGIRALKRLRTGTESDECDYYTHPSINSRIRALEDMRTQQQIVSTPTGHVLNPV